MVLVVGAAAAAASSTRTHAHAHTAAAASSQPMAVAPYLKRRRLVRRCQGCRRRQWVRWTRVLVPRDRAQIALERRWMRAVARVLSVGA